MLFQVSLHELEDFAIRFWSFVKEAMLFAFYGEMGAGKTTIITALCRQKGVKDVISSPTFSIINEYRFFKNEKEEKVFHLDLYRLNSMEDIIQAGVEDCIYSKSICFIEWPEKAPGLLDKTTLHAYIKILDSTTRQIKIEREPASVRV
jgi:tRNA threonylcarbamoyladenosine biosynthesis protein TsaE